MIDLRPYQQTVLDNLLTWFEQNPTGNPIISACVGAGKSIIIGALCHLAVRGYADYHSRVLMLVPSKELLEQNWQRLIAVAPDLKTGIVSASIGRKDTAFDKDVIIATPGSAYKNPGQLGRLDLILIDECHLVNRKETGMYRQLIADCQKFNPKLRVIGLTGTPFRGNGVWLTEGETRLFTDIAARVSMSELLKQNYLSPLTAIKTGAQVTGDDIKTAHGDYVVSDLAKKLDRDDLTQTIADDLVSIGTAHDRKKWLVFGVTVDHATHLAEALRARGIATGLVHGKTPKIERERIIKDFRQSRTRALVNVAVLTTGFDVPDIDLIALVRNTQSPVLYTQIAGRGMRIAEGKTDCLWLDYTDTTQNLGPVDQIKGRAEPKPQNTPFKICPDCGSTHMTMIRLCSQCGHEFPVSEERVLNINHEASGVAVLSQNGWQILTVSRVIYRETVSRKDRIPLLKVDYWTGMRKVCSEFICFNHTGYARTRAERWWQERYIGKLPIVPETVMQAVAMTHYLKEPKEIILNLAGQYPELIKARFEDVVEQVA